MKTSSNLTESIATSASETRGESRAFIENISPGTSETTTPGRGGDHADDTESVTISIKSSTGYEDAEVFAVRGKKAANAFARRVMAVSLRAHDRCDDAGE